jgi:hypothetical protein
MSNLLICVKSCRRDRALGYHQAIRDTWGRGLDVRFFMGLPAEERNTVNGPEVNADEIILDCKDDYESLPWKTKAILAWFLKTAYDFGFMCDNDTFILPDNLTRTDFQRYDYSGRFGEHPAIGTLFPYTDGRGNHYPNCAPWASGGIGYFLSRRAAGYILLCDPYTWAEDMFVGQCLSPYIQDHELSAADLPKFSGIAAWHFQRTKKYPLYNPEMMYRSWELGTPNLMYAEDKLISDRIKCHTKKIPGF